MPSYSINYSEVGKQHSSLTEQLSALSKVLDEMENIEQTMLTAAQWTADDKKDFTDRFANFMQAYPNVKADEIPKEVWEDAGRTFDLTGAYLRYQNRQLQEEIKTLRQNNKNKERSTGSMKSVGSRTKDQAFDALWYDDDD